MSHTMKQYDKVVATFNPPDRTTLKPDAHKDIGWRGTWQACWIIEGGQFAGQWAMMPHGPALPSFAWAPESDLQIEGAVPE